MSRAIPDLATLGRAAAVLRKDAVLTPWPATTHEHAVELPRRRIEAEAPPYFTENLERLRVLQQGAPDVVVMHDEDPWEWTAVVPSLPGEDGQKIRAGDLAELLARLQPVLEKREMARRGYIRAALDAFLLGWDDVFEVGWDGEWWYRRRDGIGGKVPAQTPEELGRRMAKEYQVNPVRWESA